MAIEPIHRSMHTSSSFPHRRPNSSVFDLNADRPSPLQPISSNTRQHHSTLGAVGSSGPGLWTPPPEMTNSNLGSLVNFAPKPDRYDYGNRFTAGGSQSNASQSSSHQPRIKHSPTTQLSTGIFTNQLWPIKKESTSTMASSSHINSTVSQQEQYWAGRKDVNGVKQEAESAIVGHMQIPSTINNSKGSLAEFAAQVRFPGYSYNYYISLLDIGGRWRSTLL
jgi:hypothetical protein